MNYLLNHGTRQTPQREPIPGSAQVANSAGGHAWAVDDWTRLRVVGQFEYSADGAIVGRMPDRSSKRPRDVNSLAHRLMQESTGEVKPVPADPNEGKDPAAVALGRRGGQKGGKARAEKMTAEERSASARKAAKARWDRSSP